MQLDTDTKHYPSLINRGYEQMRTSALMLTIFVSFVTDGVLVGEVAAEEDDSRFEEITVTAKKREQGIYKVPTAVSAFSAETMERQGVADLTDVGKFVPNLNVTGFAGGHTASVNPFIRGIGLQDHLITTDPGVGVYIDGVYLGRQIGQNWSLSKIERVEVLRGPQGTLYGRNAIGGAINIITRKPGDDIRNEIGLQAGSRGRFAVDFYSDHDLTSDLAMSVSGAFTRRNGIGEFPNIPDAEADVGELQDISARIAVEWQASDRFSLTFTADGNDGHNGLSPYTTLIDETPNGALYMAGYRNSDTSADPYDSNTGQSDLVSVTNRAGGLSLTMDYELSDGSTAKLLVSDRYSEYQAGLDDDSLLDNQLAFPEFGEADQSSVELQFSGAYGRFDYVAGIYHFEESGGNTQNPNVFLGEPGTFSLHQDTDSTAAYVNGGYAITDRLRLSAGLRYTEDKKNARIDINDALIDTSASRDWHEVSWDISASFDLNERLSLYGSAASGYQSGQFPPRPFCLFDSLDFSQPGNVSLPNCFVANDNIEAINYEAGIKGEPFRNLRLSVAAFYTDYSDLPYQVSATTSAGFDTRNIIVDQTSTGLELEGTLALSDNLLVHGSLGYIHVDVDDPEAVAPLTPKLTAAVSPELAVPMSSGGRLTVRADWSFRDDMYGEPTADPGRHTAIDSRGLINVDVSYQSANDDWTLGIYGRNITDERYENARLNTGDYIIVMLSNDASELGLRFTSRF